MMKTCRKGMRFVSFWKASDPVEDSAHCTRLVTPSWYISEMESYHLSRLVLRPPVGRWIICLTGRKIFLKNTCVHEILPKADRTFKLSFPNAVKFVKWIWILLNQVYNQDWQREGWRREEWNWFLNTSTPIEKRNAYRHTNDREIYVVFVFLGELWQ